MAKVIPVYDICKIDQQSQKDLLIERFELYLKKYYYQLHRPHKHSFYHLVLFTKGKGSHAIDFRKFSVKPFQLYFMAPGQVHSWDFEGNVNGYIVHFNEILFNSFLQNSRYLERFPFFSGNVEESVCELPPAVQTDVVSLFESMLQELENDRLHSIDLIRLRLLELFMVVDRNVSGRKGRPVPPQKLVLIRSFQQLIDKNFRTIRLPKEYAEQLYITSNHLNAVCQDLLGKTAGDIIRDRVLLEAKRLLSGTDMTVAEIAYDLNFQDNSYFSRFFKKYEGQTPEGFRKQFSN